MLKADMSDFIALVGIGMLGYGLYLISLPLMLIVLGSIGLLVGLFSALRRAR